MNKTITVKCDDRSEPCVLIEGPMWADAKVLWPVVAGSREGRSSSCR